MSAPRKTVELVSKDGKKTWSTSDPVEITNLKARGWSIKAAEAPVADKATAPKSIK